MRIKNTIKHLAKTQGSYNEEAYYFVFEALEYTMNKYEKQGHVSGAELLEGIKELALDKFGPMARTVLAFWGITKTDDFGRIVFILVDNKLLGKQPDDSLNDFINVYDFESVFDNPFRG